MTPHPLATGEKLLPGGRFWIVTKTDVIQRHLRGIGATTTGPVLIDHLWYAQQPEDCFLTREEAYMDLFRRLETRRNQAAEALNQAESLIRNVRRRYAERED